MSCRTEADCRTGPKVPLVILGEALVRSVSASTYQRGVSLRLAQCEPTQRPVLCRDHEGTWDSTVDVEQRGRIWKVWSGTMGSDSGAHHVA